MLGGFFMKQCFVVVFFAVLTMNLLVNAQTANPASDFEYDLDPEGVGVVIKKYKGKAKNVIIPSMIEDFPVIALKDGSFAKSDIVSVVIPDSVVYMWGSFRSCKSLAKVTLPKGIEKIYVETFAFCSSLKEIVLPEGLKEIDTAAFPYSGLESISIPDSVSSIGSYAFNGCKALKSVVIGNGVHIIEESAFANCKSLADIAIGDSLQTVEQYAFENCTSLVTVNIGNGIQTIGNEAFKNCSSLTSFNIGVEYLYSLSRSSDVFKGCSSLSLKEKAKIRKTGYTGSF